VASAGCVIIVSAFEAPTVVAGFDDVAMGGQAVDRREFSQCNSVIAGIDHRAGGFLRSAVKTRFRLADFEPRLEETG
jgi:hypothetical protein